MEQRRSSNVLIIRIAHDLRDEASDWARGRMWIPRALLLSYLVYADYRLFTDPDSSTIFSGITLAFHEMGHVLFSFLHIRFITVLMGSGTQVLIPIVVIVLFYKQQRDFFGMSVGGFWLSFSLFELARYVGDARAMELPLVNIGGGEAEHDWFYLLSTTHMLSLDHTFAFLIRVVALATGAASLTFAVWLFNEMRKPKAKKLVLPVIRSRGGQVPSPVQAPTSDAAAKWDELSKDLSPRA